MCMSVMLTALFKFSGKTNNNNTSRQRQQQQQSVANGHIKAQTSPRRLIQQSTAIQRRPLKLVSVLTDFIVTVVCKFQSEIN